MPFSKGFIKDVFTNKEPGRVPLHRGRREELDLIAGPKWRIRGL
jgi:hypothetical protein